MNWWRAIAVFFLTISGMGALVGLFVLGTVLQAPWLGPAIIFLAAAIGAAIVAGTA
jgi:hypothetical protein